ncbi:TolC family protein [Rufibacter immobilis]|uniref:TolC family protein n=1 Tax=Rufibacter immobilis TaxID=1348778 RepID=A0A3M9N2B1_9BACT|nr:TolC family protein [Rufibacter immobilis]RNI31939.1 TolC family protein [Rufibacter immobilis]
MIKEPIVLSLLLWLLVCLGVQAQELVPQVLTLDELFTLAEQNSQQLQVSRTGIELAGQQRAVAETQQRPSLSVSASGSYLGDVKILNPDLSEARSVEMPHFGNSFSVQASQVVFKGGAILNSIERAQLSQEVAQLNFDKNRADIKLLLVARYVDLYRLARQREVYQRNIELAQLRMKNIQNLYKQGMVTRNDLLRSELQITNLSMAVQEVSNNLAISNHQLRQIVGLPANIQIVPDSSFLQTQLETRDYHTYLDLALQNFPDLKAGQVNVDIARKNLQIAKADKLPTVSLQAGNSLSRPLTNVSPAIDMYSQGWNMGVGISYNLSSLYNARHSIAVANTAVIQQQQMLALQRQNIENEVNSAFIKHNEARDRSRSFAQGVRLANENYRIVEKKYYGNLALIVDLLDATNAKLDAELQKANADANIFYTYYQLQRLAGNL